MRVLYVYESQHVFIPEISNWRETSLIYLRQLVVLRKQRRNDDNFLAGGICAKAGQNSMFGVYLCFWPSGAPCTHPTSPLRQADALVKH